MTQPLSMSPVQRGIHTLTVPAAAPRGALSAAAKAAWLVLRDEGGYWTATELGLRLQPGAAPEKAGQSAVRWLSALSARGHVRISPCTRINSYGVTARCIPLPGHTLNPATPTTPKGTL